jgi:hypothetical protein
MMDLKIIMEKNRINTTTATNIIHNIGNWLDNKDETICLASVAPDATKNLKQAFYEQQKIGWDQWMNGKWAKEWATLICHDIKNIDSGVRHNTPIQWATEIINFNRNYVHDCWKQRNIIEHDADGSPETRKKKKMSNIYWGYLKE